MNFIGWLSNGAVIFSGAIDLVLIRVQTATFPDELLLTVIDFPTLFTKLWQGKAAYNFSSCLVGFWAMPAGGRGD